MINQTRMQDARAVAYRALSLGALLKRCEFERAVQNLDEIILFDDVRHKFIRKHRILSERLQQWLIDEGIAPHLSQNERYLLDLPLGKWSERVLTTVGWRCEALGMMLWALQRLDHRPDYDTPFALLDVLEPLDIFNPTIDFIWLATLRDDHALDRCRDQAELWNWRSRATELERMGVRPPEGVSFREIIRETAQRAYHDGHIRHPINGDFPAFNKPYVHLDDDEYNLLSAIAYERYFALNWVCELSSEWENVPIDR